MSIEHTELGDYLAAREPVPGQESADDDAWALDRPHCRRCIEELGEAADQDPYIDPNVGRVVGDNDDCVERCSQCTDGVTSDVVAALGGRDDGFRVAPEGRR